MYKLILADDEAVIRRGLSLLRWDELGFHLAETFADGGEVIDYLKREGADVVLTDIVMPHVSGLEVARWVYENAPQTKVVLLSGYAEFSDAQKAIEYHVSRYLLKPTDRGELAAQFRAIRQELDGREDAIEAQEGSLQQQIDLYLDRRLADGASLTGAAEFVHMNPAHLSRAFKEETGENYNNYVLRRRMDAAKNCSSKAICRFRKSVAAWATPTCAISPAYFAKPPASAPPISAAAAFAAENKRSPPCMCHASASHIVFKGNTAQMRRLAGEWIFRQMQIPKVYWR